MNESLPHNQKSELVVGVFSDGGEALLCCSRCEEPVVPIVGTPRDNDEATIVGVYCISCELRHAVEDGTLAVGIAREPFELPLPLFEDNHHE